MTDKLLKATQRTPLLDATPWRPGDFALGSLESRAAVRVMLAERQAARQREAQGAHVQDAVRDTYTWVTEHTKTFNEHWLEEGRPSPYEPFPRHEYLATLFEILDAQRIVWIEKSRDLMISWACVAYLTFKAMTIPECGVLFQTQKENKAIQLVDYAKCLYDRQPDFLRDAFPLTKPTKDQPALSLEFKHGGYISGIPGGADQIRSYHPWGYLNDESSFQPEAGECYNEALAAVKGKIIFNSSAGPSWYADARHDIIRNGED
jgi:hypothetical protein